MRLGDEVPNRGLDETFLVLDSKCFVLVNVIGLFLKVLFEIWKRGALEVLQNRQYLHFSLGLAIVALKSTANHQPSVAD